MIDGVGDMSEPIGAAVRAVPRHLFVPPVALVLPFDGAPELIDRDADPDAWWNAVYSGLPVITQLDGGATDIRRAEGDYRARPAIIAWAPPGAALAIWARTGLRSFTHRTDDS